LIQGDVRALAGIADGSFEIALDGHCLHCIIGGPDRQSFLRAAHRILKPQGILAISTMCNEVPPTWVDQFDPQTRCMLHGDVTTRYIGDSNDILQEIIQAGFRVLELAVVPPSDEEDVASLDVIAQKR
jgi:ubiquinone/menaquinone biosynthesis C-methylase UbiE